MRTARGPLMAFGTMIVFISSASALNAMGVEDAVEACFIAGVIATLLTWAILP